MFRHRGKTRTLQHNLRIASLLSFVAGVVNVAGFLSVQRLTTNVTGHFAFFVDEIIRPNFLQAFIFFLYIFFFFLGSFLSSFCVELLHKRHPNHAYVLPAVLESAILLMAAFFGRSLVHDHPDALAFLLLFAMGLQNSLVTSISKAAVRTTHLTGLFTDLGIELSQLFFYKQPEQKHKLYSSIRLRLTIICFFFIGGIVGGLFYSTIQLNVLILAGGVLVTGIMLDYIKYNEVSNKEKHVN
ncbi:MAG TPA: YoaK family protein [Cyclobacteriaceae bacterium]|jgi:uncharacterized membrane protein YoaK (UPF0700 family)|nr:YoaK family protein [Cyclobacteriaceae bacterium]